MVSPVSAAICCNNEGPFRLLGLRDSSRILIFGRIFSSRDTTPSSLIIPYPTINFSFASHFFRDVLGDFLSFPNFRLDFELPPFGHYPFLSPAPLTLPPLLSRNVFPGFSQPFFSRRTWGPRLWPVSTFSQLPAPDKLVGFLDKPPVPPDTPTHFQVEFLSILIKPLVPPRILGLAGGQRR